MLFLTSKQTLNGLDRLCPPVFNVKRGNSNMQSIYDHANSNGYNFEPVFNGEIHRFQPNDRRDKSGWFIGHILNEGQKNELKLLIYGDWSKNEKYEWLSKGRFSKDEKEIKERELNKLRQKIESKKHDENKAAKILAKKYYEGCSDLPQNFKYLEKKQISVVPGAKYDMQEQVLVLPLYENLKKEISTYQTISEDGQKFFLKDGKKKGSFFYIEGSKDKILICEGFATGASVHQATGFFTIIAFDAGNILPVTEKMVQIFGKNNILVCADNDVYGIKNAGIEAAKEVSAKLGVGYVAPEFKDNSSKPNDFNDLYILEGLDQVKETILKTENTKKEKSDGFLEDYESFKSFFDIYLKGAIKDKLSQEYKIPIRGKWQPAKSRLKVFKSDCHTNGLNLHFTDVHLAKYMEDQPERLLYDVPEWDGEDRFLKIFACLSFHKDGMDPDTCFDLFKWWLACIPARIENSMNQNKIIVLRGPQNIGKDTFCNKIFGKAFESYYVNIEPQENNKENFQTVFGKLVANISEFDQTNKMSLASIKNLITANSIRMRMPYEPAPQDYEFHTSFISSSNFESILRDTSGNRRYMIFDIEKIKFEYDQYLDGKQLLAQIYALYKSKYEPKESSINELKRFIENETPDNIDELILDAIKEILGKKTGAVPYSIISSDVQRVAKEFQVSVFRAQGIMKRGGVQKKSNGTRLYGIFDKHRPSDTGSDTE